MLAGFTFMVTDYAETIPEVIQLFRMQGDDALANLASKMGTIKITAMIITVLGISTKLVLDKSASETVT